jgi:hypothetical protein
MEARLTLGYLGGRGGDGRGGGLVVGHCVCGVCVGERVEWREWRGGVKGWYYIMMELEGNFRQRRRQTRRNADVDS